MQRLFSAVVRKMQTKTSKIPLITYQIDTEQLNIALSLRICENRHLSIFLVLQ